ncbi:MAG: hypothetical protein KY468_05230, partial [Armatimonadetes bacterium]|nr:hypothetical protein [Armatimonadota bacterium]
ARCATRSKTGEAAVTETVRTLLAHGADPTRATASKYTALKWAQIRNHPTALRLIQAKLSAAGSRR